MISRGGCAKPTKFPSVSLSTETHTELANKTGLPREGRGFSRFYNLLLFQSHPCYTFFTSRLTLESSPKQMHCPISVAFYPDSLVVRLAFPSTTSNSASLAYIFT